MRLGVRWRRGKIPVTDSQPALDRKMRQPQSSWRENQDRLAGCSRPHDFVPTGAVIPQTNRPSHYACTKCAGVLHWELAEPYMEGLADGRASMARPSPDVTLSSGDRP